MLQTWVFILVALSFTANGCFGLPFAHPELEDEPEQYMTGMTHPEDHTGHEDHTDMPMDHGSMKMYFHSSVHATILFGKWHTMNWWELLLSCIAIAVLALLYEGFKSLREFVAVKTKRKTLTVTPTKDAIGNGSTAMMIEEDTLSSSDSSMLSSSHLIQSALHFVQLFLSYSLMLVFMTYNIYLCLALCLGGAIGYFIFAHNRSFKADNEHCN